MLMTPKGYRWIGGPLSPILEPMAIRQCIQIVDGEIKQTQEEYSWVKEYDGHVGAY